MKLLFPQEEKANGKRTTALVASFWFAAGNKQFCFQNCCSNRNKIYILTNYDGFITIMLTGRASLGIRACNSVVKNAAAGQQSSQRGLSASAKVWINKETRVICQGFTGKQVRV
jgi:hypothetical protein